MQMHPQYKYNTNTKPIQIQYNTHENTIPNIIQYEYNTIQIQYNYKYITHRNAVQIQAQYKTRIQRPYKYTTILHYDTNAGQYNTNTIVQIQCKYKCKPKLRMQYKNKIG